MEHAVKKFIHTYVYWHKLFSIREFQLISTLHFLQFSAVHNHSHITYSQCNSLFDLQWNLWTRNVFFYVLFHMSYNTEPQATAIKLFVSHSTVRPILFLSSHCQIVRSLWFSSFSVRTAWRVNGPKHRFLSDPFH